MSVVTVDATDVLIDGPPHVTNENAHECIPSDDTVAAGLPSKLSLVIGCRVMLLYNINCKDGLVNGSCGIVTNIEYEESGAHKPSAILVKFDDTCVGKIYSDSTVQEAIPIAMCSAKFYGKCGTIFKRTTFPLMLCFACTCHKVQGLTLENAVIDIGRSIFTAGQVYVALSRVKTLEGLALVDYDRNRIYANSTVHEEMSRLHSLFGK